MKGTYLVKQLLKVLDKQEILLVNLSSIKYFIRKSIHPSVFRRPLLDIVLHTKMQLGTVLCQLHPTVSCDYQDVVSPPSRASAYAASSDH